MRLVLLAAALALAVGLPAARAGSAEDNWGKDTLINLPSGVSRGEVPEQAGDAGDTTPVEVPCQCSDADPRDELTQEVAVDCYYQRIFGACNQDFMFDANPELLPEYFCQMSCSRCSCCVSAAEIIASLGGRRFLQAAEAAGLTQLLSHPGFEGTVLMPTDAAFEAATQRYGDLLQKPGVLAQVLKFHILPPEAERQGLWNSPFMSLGPSMETLYDGPERVTSQKFNLPSDVTWQGGLTGFTLSGPANEATVTRSDATACKAYVTEIDAVLLPFDPEDVSSGSATASGAAVGADACVVMPNAVIVGSDVSTSTQSTIGDCCDACASADGCNAWTYCALDGGCLLGDGTTKLDGGSCILKQSPNIADDREPDYLYQDAMTTFAVSGFIPTARMGSWLSGGGQEASSPSANVAAAGRR